MRNIDLATSFAHVGVAIAIIMALVQCLFGYRLQRLMASITGFFFGGILGTLIAMLFLPKDNNMLAIALVIGLVTAIIGAIIAFALYKVGVFIYMFTTVFTFVYNVFEIFKHNPTDIKNYEDRAANMVENLTKGNFSNVNWVALVTAAIVGILVAIITLMYLRNVMIFTTALCGSVSIVAAVFLDILNYSNGWLMALSIVVLTALCCVFQFKTTKKYQHKKSR